MNMVADSEVVIEEIDAIEIDDIETRTRPEFSVCTLVTEKEQYREMLTSFGKAGFGSDRCEYIYIDNSNSNKLDAYSGINRFFRVAQGQYVIVCHQDVRLEFDNIDDLERIIAEMSEFDASWAVLGNAGGSAPGEKAIRITDPFYGKDAKIGEFPVKVSSVDENFILVRKDAGIGISRDMSGFHMYGTDLCQIACILGYSAYVVDFHLRHICGEVIKTWGKKPVDPSTSLDTIRRKLIKKYKRAFAPRWIQTTCTIVHISGSDLRNFWANRKLIYSVRKRLHRWGIIKGQARSTVSIH